MSPIQELKESIDSLRANVEGLRFQVGKSEHSLLTLTLDCIDGIISVLDAHEQALEKREQVLEKHEQALEKHEQRLKILDDLTPRA